LIDGCTTAWIQLSPNFYAKIYARSLLHLILH